ncbi:hypothetical protein DENSPDRAFT_843767 [Dentipellis sp. KUC8613]|nr:hypothetical protein DENSPDRAFT_843767 [Dentipellis sp. KUC8613]
MSSHSVHGVHHAGSTSHPIQSEASHQSTQNPPRTTWSEPYFEKVRQEHLAVLAESKALSDQYSIGNMTIDEYARLDKQYVARLEALGEELEKEMKKETPSTVQRAIDWGYSEEEAERIWRNVMKWENFYSNLGRNGHYRRRDVRGH